MDHYELRWFAPGEVPAAQLRAFAEGKLERRRDEYLLGTGDALGIKRRGGSGRLERKKRLECLTAALEFGAQRHPIAIERWRKTKHDKKLPEQPAWGLVDKSRARRRVGGCLAELTDLRLQLPGHAPLAFASLGFDASGPAAVAMLLLAARTLFEADPALAARFVGAPSMGYPGWLAASQRSS